MVLTIESLPVEVLIDIFEQLSLKDALTCSRVCRKWKNLVAQFLLASFLRKIAKSSESINANFHEEGWTENCEDVDLIINVYNKFIRALISF